MTEWIEYDGFNRPKGTARCRIRRGSRWESVSFRAANNWVWGDDVTHFLLKDAKAASGLPKAPPKIRMDESYLTRGGRKVRILCTDADGKWPVIGLIEGKDSSMHWSINGRVSSGYTSLDLVLVPEKRTVWVNIYDGHSSTHYDTEKAAREAADNGAIGVAVPVTFNVMKGFVNDMRHFTRC